MARKLKKEGISSSFDSRGSYKEQLVHLKDPVPYLDTPDTVYHVQCEGTPTTDCNQTYIGETGRCTSTRMLTFQNLADLQIVCLGNFGVHIWGFLKKVRERVL